MTQQTKRNYQLEMEKAIESRKSDPQVPTLLLHACCAPCSSASLEKVVRYFRVTVFFYNPNITLSSEYEKRVEEEKRLIREYNREIQEGCREGYPIEILEGDFEPAVFLELAKGLEDCPEGGERCVRCYEQRLRKTAELVKEKGYDYFTTTLTISPMKSVAKLNTIGESLAQEYGITWLPSDFKKKNGYLRSIELSAEYDLYRQDYCGCAYSKAQRERERK